MRTMLFHKEQAAFRDIWHVIGLRGTGSNEYEVRDLFVPEAYTTWRDQPSDRRDDGPLYNIPLLTLYGIGFSGVGLGLAAACLDAFMALAATKNSRGSIGSAGLLRDSPIVQSRTAEATGRLQSARAFLLDMLREIWDASVTKGGFTLDQRARLPACHHRRARPVAPRGRFHLSRRRHHGDLHRQRVRAALSRHAHGDGAGPGPHVQLRNPPARRCSASSRASGCRPPLRGG